MVCLVVGLLILTSLFVAHPIDYAPVRRDATRWAAIAQQMQLLDRYVRRNGQLPDLLTKDELPIGSEDGMIDLCPYLVPGITDELPYDPKEGVDLSGQGCLSQDSAYATGFSISKTADDKVTITAPYAETGEKISLTTDFKPLLSVVSPSVGNE